MPPLVTVVTVTSHCIPHTTPAIVTPPGWRLTPDSEPGGRHERGADALRYIAPFGLAIPARASGRHRRELRHPRHTAAVVLPARRRATPAEHDETHTSRS